MVSCFFCQSLLSDLIEGLLPASRQTELEEHLKQCKSCRNTQEDLKKTISLTQQAPLSPLSKEISLRVLEAASSKSGATRRIALSRALIGIAAVILLISALPFVFPGSFTWMDRTSDDDDIHFTRYFPLMQGAESLVEEQANWLFVREPLARSVWEEGGLSPEEFEKSFQGHVPGEPGQ